MSEDGKSRKEYMQQYNKENPTKSIRFPAELIEKLDQMCIAQNKSFTKVAIQLIEAAIHNEKGDQKCNTLLAQLYEFFKKQDVSLLDVNQNDMDMLKEVRGSLR